MIVIPRLYCPSLIPIFLESRVCGAAIELPSKQLIVLRRGTDGLEVIRQEHATVGQPGTVADHGGGAVHTGLSRIIQAAFHHDAAPALSLMLFDENPNAMNEHETGGFHPTPRELAGKVLDVAGLVVRPGQEASWLADRTWRSLAASSAFAAGRDDGTLYSAARKRVEAHLFLNPDTLISENTLAESVRFLSERGDGGLMGPKTLNPDGTLQVSCRRVFHAYGCVLPAFRTQ